MKSTNLGPNSLGHKYLAGSFGLVKGLMGPDATYFQ